MIVEIGKYYLNNFTVTEIASAILDHLHFLCISKVWNMLCHGIYELPQELPNDLRLRN